MRVAVLVLALGLVPATGALAQQQSDHEKAQEALGRASALQTEGRIRDALEVLDETIATLDVWEAMDVALALRRADMRRYFQDYEGAVEDLERAEALVGDTRHLANTYRTEIHGLRGDVAVDQGLIREAARSYEESLAWSERIDRSKHTPFEWFTVRKRLCKLWLAREDFSTLERHVREWLEDPVYDLAVATGLRAHLLRFLGYALRELEAHDPDRPREARELLVRALPDTLPADRIPALARLAELDLREGALEDARGWLDQADKLLQPREDGDLPGFIQDRLAVAWVRACVERLGSEDSATRARCARTLDEEMERFAAGWRDQPLRHRGYGPLHFGPIRGALSERLEYALLEAASEESALAEVLAASHRVTLLGTVARRLDSHAPTLTELRQELLGGDRQRGVLLYLPGPWTSHLVLIGVETIGHVRLAHQDTLNSSRSELLRAMRVGAPRAELDAQRRALGALLLPPEALAVCAGWSRWSVTGLDVLGETPFEDLIADDAGPLGTRYAIDHLPSIPVAMSLHRRERSVAVDLDAAAGGPLVLLLAATRPAAAARAHSESIVDLPVGRDRLHRLLQAYPNGTAEVLMDDEAGYGALKRGADHRVLEILAHGLDDPERDRGMLLALAPDEQLADGLLGSDALAGLHMPPLVILAACRGGAEPMRSGDAGSGGFGGQLLLAGASTVVLFRNDLALDVALEASELIHASLAAGDPPAEAVRKARASLFADDSLDGLSGLQVLGLGQRPLFRKSPSGPSAWWWALAAAPVLLWRRARRRSRHQPP